MADESYPTKTLTVNFSEDDTQTDENYEIAIELDSELNEDKSEFKFGEDCYFRIFSSHSDYAVKTSHSTCKVKKRNSTGTESTELTMADTDNGSVSHDINGLVGIDFSGKGRSTSYVTEAEKLINSGGDLLGFLNVEYSFEYDSWKLQGISKPEDYNDEEDPGFKILVVAKNRTATASLVVAFKNEVGDDATGENGDGKDLNIELDSTKNIDKEGKTKTTFEFGEQCYFRVYSEIDYTTNSSAGGTSNTGAEVGVIESEKIAIADIAEFSVSKKIKNIIGSEFSGKGIVGSLTIGEDGKTLTNSGGELLGFLTISYSIDYFGGILSNVPKPEDYNDEEDPGFEVIIVAKNEEDSSNVTVTFKNTTGDADEDEDEDGSEGSLELSVELDDSKNIDTEGNSISEFAFNEVCYFRVYSDESFITNSSYGVTTTTGKEVGVIENEKIAVADIDTFSSSKKIKALIDTNFTGKGSIGSLTIGEDGKTIKNSGGELLGFVYLTYFFEYYGGTLRNVSKPEDYNDEEDPGFEVIILAETESNKANTSATFKINPGTEDDETEDDDGSRTISIFVDPETSTNKSDPADPESGLKSEFKFGEVSVFRVVMDDMDREYDVYHSIEYGSLVVEGVLLQKIAEKDEFTHTEEISFDLSSEGNLTYTPTSNVSWEWINETAGEDPTFNEKIITVEPETIGTLRVSYKTIGDLWSLLVTEFIDVEKYLLDTEAKIPVTLVAKEFENKASANVTYVHPESESGEDNDDSESSLSISIELDETKNLEEEPNEDGEYDSKSDFLFEEDCYFRVFSDSSSIEIESSHGEASILAPETAIIEDEKISFAGTDTASTSKKIKSIISTEFDGRGEIGSFKIGEDGKELKNSRGDLVGFLTVSYTTECWSGVLTGVMQPEDYDTEENEGQEVIVLASIVNDDASASVSANFKGEEPIEEGEISIGINDVVDDGGTPIIEGNFVYDSEDDEWSLKSSFEFGSAASLRLIKNSEDTSYEVKYSLDKLTEWHSIKKTETNKSYVEIQTITFSNSDTGSLSYTPTSINSYRWLHDAPNPTPEFDGKEIKLESPVVGFLEVEYTVVCDHWELFVDEIVGDEYATVNDEGLRELKVAVVVYNADNSASTEVSFADEEQSEADIDISCALDELSNKELYGEAKSTFKYGEKAYIKVFGPRPISGFANWNSATLRLDAPYYVYEYEDRLTVVNTDEASLTMKPVGNVAWEWEGSATQGVPTFDEKKITFNQKIKCGILKATYFTMGQRWYVTLPQDPDPDNPTDEEGVEDTSTEVLCVFIPDNYTDDSASLSVTFKGEPGEEMYEIIIVNHCSGEPIQGAYIEGIDGLIGGKTSEANGRVFKGKLPFRTYNVGNITKDGYLSSHGDPISNESFEIKPEEE